MYSTIRLELVGKTKDSLVQRRLTAGFKNHSLCPSKASCRLFHLWEAEGLNVTLAGRGSGQKEIRKERKRNTLKTSLS